jgi:hypothetical protein
MVRYGCGSGFKQFQPVVWNWFVLGWRRGCSRIVLHPSIWISAGTCSALICTAKVARRSGCSPS